MALITSDCAPFRLLVTPPLAHRVEYHEDTTVHLKVITDHPGKAAIGWSARTRTACSCTPYGESLA